MKIRADEIQVFRCDSTNFNLSGIDYLKVLSETEQNEIKRLKFDKDKNIKTISRFLLRILLSRYLNKKPEEIILVRNKFGKPELVGDQSQKIKFNYSHSDKFIIFAFILEDEIGVDIEKINLSINHTELADNNFSKHEINHLKISGFEIVEKFFGIWTRKEALLKAAGIGLTIDLKLIDVLHEEVEFLEKNIGTNILKNFRIKDLSIDPAFKSAVAYSGSKREFIIQNVRFEYIQI